MTARDQSAAARLLALPRTESLSKKAVTRIDFLDGFRGLSIFMVMFSHTLFFHRQDSTFLFPFFDAELAMKVFFVVSGFIISHLLMVEREISQRIDLRRFFLKRVSKLFPTLFLVIATVGVLTSVLGWSCGSRHFLEALTFTSGMLNDSCWYLAHTWTLSVEEIFYVSWAPLFATLGFLACYAFLPFIFILSPLVRALNHMSAIPKYQAALSWYHPLPAIPHLDVILSGCLFALLLHKRREALTGFVNRNTWMIPLLLGVLYFLNLPLYRMPGVSFLSSWSIPFSSTLQSLALGYLTAAMFVGRRIPGVTEILTSRPLVYLGKISYSLYLWQQLFLMPNAEQSVGLAVARVGLAIAAGALSFHFFEEPVRRALRRRWAL